MHAAQTGGVAPTSIKKGNSMKVTLTAAVLAAAALAGCSSLPESVRHPFSGAGQTQSNADVHKNTSSQPATSPYPKETDEGRF
jgi:uncharacterized lipoprotein